MKILCVHWMDAALHPEWTETHETANVMPIKTVGYLLEQDDERIVKLAQSCNGNVRFSAIQTVPTSTIITSEIIYED